MLNQPVLFVVTLPFRALPIAWLPLTLNLCTALCAALTLALLARSVSLLPRPGPARYLRPPDKQRAPLQIPSAWVPPLLAVLACGLQLSFWENAISATGEMLDLLLFAYVVRCLLEFRTEREQSWLDRAALVYGVALANNWGMLCFLPLFVIALFRIRLWKFFDPKDFRRDSLSRFALCVLRLALFGLAGSALFLLLPLVLSLSPDSPLTFWQALRAQAGSYWGAVHFLFRQFLRVHRSLGVLMALSSLLPVAFMSIRSKSFADDDNSDPLGLTTLILKALHAGFLLVCLWAACDPFFSARHIATELGLSISFLSLYYLGALSIGYYSGAFLLTAQATSLYSPRWRRTLEQAQGWIFRKLIYLLTALTAAGLIYKNLPLIRVITRPDLRHWGELIARSLPPEGAVVLSDDPLRLRVLQAALASGDMADRHMIVDLQLLFSPAYQEHLRRKYPKQWPGMVTSKQSNSAGITTSGTNSVETLARPIHLVNALAESNRLCYLHPACGSLFEQFYLVPRGLVYDMKRLPTNAIAEPPVDRTAQTNNEAFWSVTVETATLPLQAAVADYESPPTGLRQRLLKSARVAIPPPFHLKVLAQWYSSALNSWGVSLQRNGQIREASRYFQYAQELNPNNPAARANYQCNGDLLAGRPLTVNPNVAAEMQLEQYRNWNQLLTDHGPFDAPGFCVQEGLIFAQSRLFRQSAQQFQRVKALVSGDIGARLALCSLFNLRKMPDQTMAMLTEIRNDPKFQPVPPTAQIEMALLEAGAWHAKTNLAQAEALVTALLAKHTNNPLVLNRAMVFSTEHGYYRNALIAADHLLRINPDDVSALVSQGCAFIKLGGHSSAIPPLTRALALTNAPVAQFNRAIAYLQVGNLDAAEADYLELQTVHPNAFQINFGLGEIACRRKDTNAAISHYQNYLSTADPETAEARFVVARLRALKASSH